MPAPFPERRNKSLLSVRKRFAGLNSRDRMLIKKRKKQSAVFFVLAMLLQVAGNVVASRLMVVLMLTVLSSYVKVAHFRPVVVPPSHRTNRRIVDWSTRLTECEEMFRFPFDQLARLFRTLRLPDMCVLENGSVFHAEEVFLLSLNRFAFPQRLVTACKNEFGRDYSQASRAFKFFVTHVFGTFADLVFDNLDFWQPYFALMAAKIQAKVSLQNIQT
jgi:hypothetical protein